MSEGTVGLIILTAIALGSVLVWHWLVAFYRPAVIGATITTAFVFQAAGCFHLGCLDPFFLVAALTSSLMAGAIAMLVGLPFRAWRKSHVSTSKAL